MVGSEWWAVHGGQWVVAGTRWAVSGGRYTVGSEWWVVGLEICSMYLGMSVVQCVQHGVGKDGISRPPNDLGRYSRDGSAHLGSPRHIFRYFLAGGSKVRSTHVRGRSAMVSSQLRQGIRASL